MKKFVIYTTLILTLFFSVNTDALFHGDIVQILGNTDVLAQETPTNCGSYLNVGCHIKQAIGDGIQEIKSSIASQIEAATYGVLNIVLTYVGNAILWTFSWILFVAGITLNLTLQITVVNMSTLVNNIDAINDGWVLFRDLANITFIFILLYIAIATILELGVDTRKTITKVIIAALLINFSLFFTKVIVDGSNVLTINFYQLIGQTGGTEINSPDGGGFNINDLDGGLSSAFMQNLKLTTLYNKDGTASTSALPAGTVEDTSESILSRTLSVIPRVVFGSLLMLLAAVIFFAVSIMFVVRFVVIVFLMITAPVAFVATILPQTSGISKKWWKSLTSQAIFAPVYMIMTLITLKIMSSVQNTDVITTITSSNNAGANFIFSTNATGFVMIINFFIMFAFLVGTLVIAKMAGGMGGDWATKTGSKAVFGGMAFAGRQTIGRVGRELAQSDSLQKMKGSESRILRGAARLGMGAGTTAATSSFDFRNAKGAQSIGDLGGTISQTLGGGKLELVGKETKEGGFVQRQEKRAKDKTKKYEERAKSLEVSPEQIDREENILKNAKENKEKSETDRLKKLQSIDQSIVSYKDRAFRTQDPVIKASFGQRVTELSKEKDMYKTRESYLSHLQENVDKLKGLDGEEAEKRAKKEVGEIRTQSAGENDTDYKTYQKQHSAEIEKRKKEKLSVAKEKGYDDSLSTKRKRVYAEQIGGMSAVSRMFTLGTKRDVATAKQAIMKSLKGKKVEDLVKDALKVSGELKEDAPKTESASPESETETT